MNKIEISLNLFMISNIILPPSSISLPLSFAQSFRRNNVLGHRKKKKLLFYIKIGCMCDKKFVVPFQKKKGVN